MLLVRHLDGPGGVCRSATNLANGLVAAGLDVEILVLFRGKRPRYELDPRVQVTYVRNMRPRALAKLTPRQKELDDSPSCLEDETPGMSALTDRRLRRVLGRLEPCTLISHRPVLHRAAALWAPGQVRRLAVEHTDFHQRSERDKAQVRQAAPALDRLVVLTERNRRCWAQELGSGSKVAVIPNGVSFGQSKSLETWSAPVVVAAGSLVARKGFDRLIRAYSPLAEEFPEWRLRIFGRGGERDALARLIDEHQRSEQIQLAGYTRSLDQEMLKSSVYAMSSHSEGLPMVLLEAMGSGLPVVSFDCPGPDQLVESGATGLLVTDGDVDAMTSALRTLMSSEDLRRRYGQAAREHAATYHLENVVTQWRRLVRDVSR